MSNHSKVQVVLAALAYVAFIAPVQADLVMVVDAGSPISSLSRTEVSSIFLGQSSRTYSGLLVTPIDQPEGTASRERFYSAVIGKTATQIRMHWSRLIFTGNGLPPRELADTVAIKKALAVDRSMLAYMDKSKVDTSVKIVMEVP